MKEIIWGSLSCIMIALVVISIGVLAFTGHYIWSPIAEGDYLRMVAIMIIHAWLYKLSFKILDSL